MDILALIDMMPDWDLVTVEYRKLIVMFTKPVWGDLCFMTWSIILLKAAGHGQLQYSCTLWCRPVLSFAPVANLLKALTGLALRDALLHTLVNLSHCFLLIQSILWTLTSPKPRVPVWGVGFFILFYFLNFRFIFQSILFYFLSVSVF